jgi:hypothetical protein
MASKDISDKVPNRIPETKIVGPSRFRKPLDPLVTQSGTRVVSPYAASIVVGAGKGEPEPLFDKDAPNLSDISVYSGPTKKRRAGSNEIYYEIVFKVRNSSKDPSSVIGVDARIVGTEPEND